MKIQPFKHISIKDIINGAIGSTLSAILIILAQKIETPNLTMHFDFSIIGGFLLHNAVTLILAFIATIAFTKAVRKDIKITEFENELKEIKENLVLAEKDLELKKEVYEYRSYMLYIALDGHDIYEDMMKPPRKAVTNKEVTIERKTFRERWAKRYNLREDSNEINDLIEKYCKLST